MPGIEARGFFRGFCDNQHQSLGGDHLLIAGNELTNNYRGAVRKGGR